jgi:hypothetical protein
LRRFSNNDHLAVHRQKHEFSLKFGIGSKTGEALLVDQTPTPTRFLRNCEESGLFQELADNPFEQEFEKSKNGAEKLTATSETQTGRMPRPSNDPAAMATVTSTVTISSIPMAAPPAVANPDKHVPMATAPAHMTTTSDATKQKILQTIQMKEQQKLLEAQLVTMATQQLPNMSSPEILSAALKAMQEGVSKDPMSTQQGGTTATVFAAPTGVPGRK